MCIVFQHCWKTSLSIHALSMSIRAFDKPRMSKSPKKELQLLLMEEQLLNEVRIL